MYIYIYIYILQLYITIMKDSPQKASARATSNKKARPAGGPPWRPADYRYTHTTIF